MPTASGPTGGNLLSDAYHAISLAEVELKRQAIAQFALGGSNDGTEASGVVPFVVFLLLGFAGPAGAQISPPAIEEPSPHAEIGVVVSGILHSASLLGLGVRVSGGKGDRFSVEGQLDWADALQRDRDSDQVIWLFFWQVKQSLRSEGTSSLFATYGTAGLKGRTIVARGQFDSWFLPPILPIVGIGWQQAVAERMAIRVDGQFLLGPFDGTNAMPRLSAGLTIPLRGNTRR